MVAESSNTNDYVPFAKALDRAAQTVGVNFIGGFSAMVQKGITSGDEKLLQSIPAALAVTERVCSSINVASSKAGINMNAVNQMGHLIKKNCPSNQRQRQYWMCQISCFL